MAALSLGNDEEEKKGANNIPEQQRELQQDESSPNKFWILSDGREILRSPLADDILLGRGKSSQDNLGNIRMLSIIQKYQKQYWAAHRSEKRSIVEHVLDMIQNNGKTRFLRRCDEQGNHNDYGDSCWEVLTPNRKRLLEKVGHALRGRPRKPKKPLRGVGTRDWATTGLLDGQTFGMVHLPTATLMSPLASQLVPRGIGTDKIPPGVRDCLANSAPKLRVEEGSDLLVRQLLDVDVGRILHQSPSATLEWLHHPKALQLEREQQGQAIAAAIFGTGATSSYSTFQDPKPHQAGSITPATSFLTKNDWIKLLDLGSDTHGILSSFFGSSSIGNVASSSEQAATSRILRLAQWQQEQNEVLRQKLLSITTGQPLLCGNPGRSTILSHSSALPCILPGNHVFQHLRRDREEPRTSFQASTPTTFEGLAQNPPRRQLQEHSLLKSMLRSRNSARALDGRGGAPSIW